MHLKLFISINYKTLAIGELRSSISRHYSVTKIKLTQLATVLGLFRDFELIKFSAFGNIIDITESTYVNKEIIKQLDCGDTAAIKALSEKRSSNLSIIQKLLLKILTY